MLTASLSHQMLPAARECFTQASDRWDSGAILFAFSQSAACVHTKEGSCHRFRPVQRRRTFLFRRLLYDWPFLLLSSGHSLSFRSLSRHVQAKNCEFDSKNRTKVDPRNRDQTVQLHRSLVFGPQTSENASHCDAPPPFLFDGLLLWFERRTLS